MDSLRGHVVWCPDCSERGNQEKMLALHPGLLALVTQLQYRTTCSNPILGDVIMIWELDNTHSSKCWRSEQPGATARFS